jgi:hypothetical protein
MVGAVTSWTDQRAAGRRPAQARNLLMDLGDHAARFRFLVRRIVEAPTRWPSLSSSPWILL